MLDLVVLAYSFTPILRLEPSLLGRITSCHAFRPRVLNPANGHPVSSVILQHDRSSVTLKNSRRQIRKRNDSTRQLCGQDFAEPVVVQEPTNPANHQTATPSLGSVLPHQLFRLRHHSIQTPQQGHRTKRNKEILKMEPEAHGQGAELNDLLNGSQEATQAKQRCEDELPRRDVEELSEGTELSTPARESATIDEPASDEKKDGSGERPIRQKLKETSIAGLSRQPSPEDQPMPSQESASTDDNDRGRLRRKRSYDESRDADPADAESKKEDDGGHRRKRSRDSKEENSSDQEKEAEPKENRERTPSALRAPANEADKLLSPKKKRSRDQLDKDDLKLEKNEAEKTGQAKHPADGEKPGLSATNRTEEGEPEKKRHRDDSRERDVSKDDSSKVCLDHLQSLCEKNTLQRLPTGILPKSICQYFRYFPIRQLGCV
ncbi:hypothetical protein CISG_04126 [Coccidioides immitis RMSCC 3703]|uniref:Uncharacterized protein n=1 Tax=Coccidioides immitis RMSCC 3703 TaxID=454286 RepID=A0A0J8QV84_COCIT|nr:hypothetical protein CISG_04126 [Coccidioides immitis RMSCC 3703]